MTEKNKRWYEKSVSLKTFMKMLEELPLDEQCALAIDIIIEASSMMDREWDNIIKDVGDYNPKDFKRWYDKNPNLHVAIECLRELDNSQREIIVKRFSGEILNIQNIIKEEREKSRKKGKTKQKRRN